MKKMLSFLAVFVMIAAYGQSQLSPLTTSTDPQIITQWDFNNLTNSHVANPPASTGVGTASIVGMTTSGTTTVVGFNPANCNNATSPNFGWNVSNANPGTVNEARGVEFMVSTVGFENITFSFAHRVSNASTRTVRIQYTLDGSSWINLDVSESNYTQACSGRGGVDNGKIDAHNIVGDAAGDTWKNVTVNFSSISGVNNNPNFGLRVVAAHFSNSGQFRQATNSATASSGGAWRFDDITISGTPTSGGPVDPVASLSAAPSSLTGFAYVQGSGPSSSQSFQISAENLTPAAGNITVTAPANYEVSADNVTFASSIQIPYVNGELALTTVHVRLSGDLLAGPFSGSVTVSGADAPNASVSVSGSVTAPALPFSLPYTNGLRNQTDLDNALGFGFTSNAAVINTGAGGYLQLLTIGSSHFTTPVLFNNSFVSSGSIEIAFSLATFGTGSNRAVQLQRVNGLGQVVEVLETYFPTTSTYDNHIFTLDLSGISEAFAIRFAYTAGSASSIRFRDLSITEVVIPVAAIDPSSCGVEYVYLPYEFIQAVPVASATQYEFKLESGAFSATFTTTNPQARVYDFVGYQFGMTYDVSVRAFVNGEWTDFSASCSITTVASPLTEVQLLPCGSTLPNINTNIFFKAVVGASMYEYEVTNTTTNVVQTFQSTSRFFRITMLNSFDFGTTYNVRARVEFAGVWMPFGPSCSLSTPQNVTQLRPVSCDVTLPNVSTPINAQSVSGATEYEFEVKNASTNVIEVITNTQPNVNLSMLSVLPSFNQTYEIRVRAKVNDVYGAFGPMCTVTTPIPTTELRSSSCNVLLAANTTPIFANSVIGATEYQFEVTNMTTEAVEVITRSVRNFHLGLLQMGVTSGTVYQVRVRAFTNGDYIPYGSSCTVTTPSETSALKSTILSTDFRATAFPVPFKTNFTLTFEGANGTSTINVYDINGRLISEINTNESVLQLGSDLNTGVYLVRIQNATNVQILRVIKE